MADFYATEITLLVQSFIYDKSTGTYSIKLANATLTSQDTKHKTLTFQISPKNVHKRCQTMQINELSEQLDDAQMDYLLDEIDLENEHQTQSQSSHTSTSNDTVISDTLLSEWNLNYNNKYHIQICDGNLKCKECESCKRIQFILGYYAQWMEAKNIDTNTDNSVHSSHSMSTPSPGQVSMSKVMRTFGWITDFFLELTNYSSYDLSNDFAHILQYHIKANTSARAQTMQYFENSLDRYCNDMQCKCYLRHKTENKIKPEYFIHCDSANMRKSMEFKVNTEINLQQILDKIHVCLLHQKHTLILSNPCKYITNVKVDNENEGKHNSEVMLGRNTFGSSITYWDVKHHRYCAPKYSDLRSELCENDIYSLSLDMYQTLKVRALHFLNTKYGKSLVCLREHDWMKKFKIICDSQITLDHCIALFCYCNFPHLQRAFKRYAYVRDGNHSKIWHYSRLLLESVHCYGTSIEKDCKYFHGIDRQLIFDRYNFYIDIPISVTSDKKIAYSLSDTNGVTVELSHGGLSDVQSLCMDLSYFSDSPLEGECLLDHSFVCVKDVIIKRLHHDQWLKILRFWHRVNEGFFSKHLVENKKISRNDQLCIMAMITNMVNAGDKSKKYDARIPKYMQKLFNILGVENGFLWSIANEYDLLIPKLRYVLCDTNSVFIGYISKHKFITVRNAQIFEWTVNAIDTNQLFLSAHPWVKSEKYKIYLNNNKNNNYLIFHFEIQNKAKSNLFRCRIHLDYKPSFVQSIQFGNGLFIQKLQFDSYSYGQLTQKKLFNLSLHSLFATDLLKEINATKDGFEIKLQIQLFAVKGKNGNLIDIDPCQ